MDERTSKRTKLSSEDLEGEDAASNDDLIGQSGLLALQSRRQSRRADVRKHSQTTRQSDRERQHFTARATYHTRSVSGRRRCLVLPDLRPPRSVKLKLQVGTLRHAARSLWLICNGCELSTALLARLQAFLPQIQQANLELPKDGSAGDDFQLIEQDDDAEEGDNRSQQDIIVPRAGGEPDSDEEDEEDPEPNPQIVFVRILQELQRQSQHKAKNTLSPLIYIQDLALGVLEPKQPQHGRTGEDASSSESKESNDSDDQEESDSAESSDASDEEDEDEENGSVDEAELSSGGGNAGPGPSAASPKQRDSSNVSVAPLSESKQTRKLVEEID